MVQLQTFFTLGVVITIAILSIGVFISDLGANNQDTSDFMDSAKDFENNVNDARQTVEAGTSEDSLSALIEEIPILGNVVKVGKYLTMIAGVIKSAVDMLIGFFKDILLNETLGVPSGVVVVVIASIVVYMGFAIYKALKT